MAMGVFVGCCTSTTIVRHRYIAQKKNLEHVLESVAGVAYLDKLGLVRGIHCAAFFVAPDILLSARHCILSDEEEEGYSLLESFDIDVTDFDDIIMGRVVNLVTYREFKYTKSPQKTKPITAQVIYVTLKGISRYHNDVVVLKLHNGQEKSEHWLTISRRKPRIGGKVYTVGMVHGLPWILAEGIVSQIALDRTVTPEKRIGILANIMVAPGSSGGPLVNNNGHVVGLAFVMRNPTLGIYVPQNILIDFLRQAKVPGFQRYYPSK